MTEESTLCAEGVCYNIHSDGKEVRCNKAYDFEGMLLCAAYPNMPTSRKARGCYLSSLNTEERTTKKAFVNPIKASKRMRRGR